MKLLLPFFLILSIISCNPQQSDKTGNSENQTLLTNGYSYIKTLLGGITLTDKVLYIRSESDLVDKYITKVAKAGRKIESELKSISEPSKWLVLNNSGQPKFQKMLLNSLTTENITNFLPVVGQSKDIFERTILLNTTGVLDQLNHSTGVLLKVETSKGRLEFLKRVKKDFGDLYLEGSKLLNSKYFKHSKYK